LAQGLLMPLWIVLTIAGGLVLFLLGYLLARWTIADAIRAHEEQTRRYFAQREVAREAERAADPTGDES
jgi:ABC-type protease/lipase transport system fused ATPase/permease subunit